MAPRRDERLERRNVRLAQGALGELDGLAGAPALRAWESRTSPEAQAHIARARMTGTRDSRHYDHARDLRRPVEYASDDR
jgi:hypothetical protein